MKHDTQLTVGFIRPSSPTSITQENYFTRIQFSIIVFFFILFSITLFHPHHPLSLIDDAHAEGSKEIIAGAAGQGRRFILRQSRIDGMTIDYIIIRAYAREGEFINMGSSAFLRTSRARIRYTSPDGTISDQCDPSGLPNGANRRGSLGVIFDFAEETAGPGTALGGYNPCVVEVPAGQDGVWEIEMSLPRGGATRCSLRRVTQDWAHSAGGVLAQANCSGIESIDVTVSQGGSFAGNDASAYGTAILGRVYQNLFPGRDFFSRNPRQWFFVPYVLTNDGFQYEVGIDEFTGGGWSLFANNKGWRNADGTPGYVSSINGPNAFITTFTNGAGDTFTMHNPLMRTRVIPMIQPRRSCRITLTRCFLIRRTLICLPLHRRFITMWTTWPCGI